MPLRPTEAPPALEDALAPPPAAQGDASELLVVPSQGEPAACAVPSQKMRPASPSVFREFGVPLILLCVSLITTTANGARFMQNYRLGIPPVVRDSDLWPWAWLGEHPAMFRMGFAFSASLLGILLIHEFGHYFACRWHKIRATLPWVLPAPTLSGTAGAIIKIRNRIPNRNALMDVGIYGPLCGYVASVIAIAFGFSWSHHTAPNAPAAVVVFGSQPITIRLIHAMLASWDPSLPPFDQIAPHPVLVAGWIGLFITSLNLIPGGQLDGGHILYSYSPKAHRLVTRFLPFMLFIMGIFYWVGWLLWGIFLLIPAMRHPKVSVEPILSRGRIALALIGFTLFLLTFSPTPFYDNSLMHFFHIDPFPSTP